MQKEIECAHQQYSEDKITSQAINCLTPQQFTRYFESTEYYTARDKKLKVKRCRLPGVASAVDRRKDIPA